MEQVLGNNGNFAGYGIMALQQTSTKIDPIARTLTWSNGADFDPEMLRNWPSYKDEMAARARQWELVLA